MRPRRGTLRAMREPPQGIAVRRLQPADVEELCRLHYASFGIRSTRRFIARAYSPTFFAPASTGFGFVATRGERAVGLAVAVLDDAAFHRALLRRHPVECMLAAALRLRRGNGLEPRRAVRGEARVHYLAVEPGERRAGLGTRLAVLAQQAIRDAGIVSCWTRIASDNGESARLHERVGFRPDPTRAAGAGWLEYRLDFPA
jgi:ribosomal protein S18 acetylase RimI-like enzyme